MKKVFFTLALLVISLATYAQEATDPSGCTMSVANFSIVPGNSAIFDINLESSARNDINTFQVYVNIPDGWTLSSPTTTTRTSGYSVDCPSDGGSATRFYVYGYHPQNKVLEGNDGAIITLTLTAPTDAVVGQTYTITCDNAMLSNGGDELDVEDFTFKVTVTDRMILDENSTAQFAPAAGVNVTVNRTIKGGEWNTICLPFALSMAKAQAAFGSDVQLATFTGFSAEFESEEDMSPDAISVNFTAYTMNARKGMATGTPYLIKTSADITSFDVDAVNISTEESFPIVRDEFEIAGTFKGTFAKTTIPEDGLFISGNKFWYSAGKTNIKAFRAWLELGEVVGKDTDFPGVKINILVDGEETKIDGINSEKNSNALYTLDGKYVGNDMNRLRKGIYIQNGKKVVK